MNRFNSHDTHEALIVDALYGTLDDAARKRFDRLIAEDAAFREQFENMRATLNVMDQRPSRDPGPEFWEGYWERLATRMQDEGIVTGDAFDSGGADRTSRSWWRRRVVGGDRGRAGWVVRAAAAAAILVLGVFLGRTWFPEVPQVAQVDQSPVEMSTVVAPDSQSAGQTLPDENYDYPVSLVSSDRAMNYVEKSRMLLMAIVNEDPTTDGYRASVASHQKRSRDLISQAGPIREELSSPADIRLRELVTELEKILLQIANLEETEDPESVEFIRGRINDHDVMLKIDLERLYGRRGGDAVVPGGTPAPGKEKGRSI